MEGDILLASALASILKNQTAKTAGVTTPTTPPTNTTGAGISQEQINQLSGAIGNAVHDAVASIQIPAPQVNIPPIEVPPAQFPSNLSVRFSDDELARITEALRQKAPNSNIKSQIYQRSILIDIGTSTIPDSTYVNAEYPSGVKVASFNFAEQAGLIGVTLSASIVNTYTKPCGFFVALASANRLNFDTTPYTATADVGSAKTPDSQILLSVFTHQNSTATTINPNTRASAISFGLDNAVSIVNSQTTLSLYAFQTINPATGLGQTGQLMSAILTAYYIPMTL